MVNLLSVNGNLQSLYPQVWVETGRSTGYKALDIGEPLVVRYLYFFIKHETSERTNELMISTFIKTTEEKQGASEAINCYRPETVFKDGEFRLPNIGAQHYGHELCYYTKSYLGESLRLTTKIMELDKVDKNIVEAIEGGVSAISGIPVFVEFVPVVALIKPSVSILANLTNLFYKDDVIESGHDLDLHFNRPNAERLQSGRIVCISEKDESDILNKYKLDSNNKLVTEDGNEYTESTYYVLQVNNEKNSLYENFDHFQHAAELLGKVNRGGNMRGVVNSVVDIAKGCNDMAAIRQIEELALDMDDKDSQKKVKALYKGMSPEMQGIYQSHVKEMLAQKND
jgi:hypothetical protein